MQACLSSTDNHQQGGAFGSCSPTSFRYQGVGTLQNSQQSPHCPGGACGALVRQFQPGQDHQSQVEDADKVRDIRKVDASWGEVGYSWSKACPFNREKAYAKRDWALGKREALPANLT
jgi:hypothetical protein